MANMQRPGWWALLIVLGLGAIVACNAEVLSARGAPVGGARRLLQQKLDDTAGIFLDRHNSLRAKHGLPPLAWDAGLAAAAKGFAATCPSNHVTSSKDQFGQNLALGHPSAGMAVDDWYSRGNAYDYGKPGPSQTAAHFTQLVWRSTTHLGCAVNTACPLVTYVCRYTPRGNKASEDWRLEVPRPIAPGDADGGAKLLNLPGLGLGGFPYLFGPFSRYGYVPVNPEPGPLPPSASPSPPPSWTPVPSPPPGGAPPPAGGPPPAGSPPPYVPPNLPPPYVPPPSNGGGGDLNGGNGGGPGWGSSPSGCPPCICNCAIANPTTPASRPVKVNSTHGGNRTLVARGNGEDARNGTHSKGEAGKAPSRDKKSSKEAAAPPPKTAALLGTGLLGGGLLGGGGGLGLSRMGGPGAAGIGAGSYQTYSYIPAMTSAYYMAPQYAGAAVQYIPQYGGQQYAMGSQQYTAPQYGQQYIAPQYQQQYISQQPLYGQYPSYNQQYGSNFGQQYGPNYGQPYGPTTPPQTSCPACECRCTGLGTSTSTGAGYNYNNGADGTGGQSTSGAPGGGYQLANNYPGSFNPGPGNPGWLGAPNNGAPAAWGGNGNTAGNGYMQNGPAAGAVGNGNGWGYPAPGGNPAWNGNVQGPSYPPPQNWPAATNPGSVGSGGGTPTYGWMQTPDHAGAGAAGGAPAWQQGAGGSAVPQNGMHPGHQQPYVPLNNRGQLMQQPTSGMFVPPDNNMQQQQQQQQHGGQPEAPPASGGSTQALQMMQDGRAMMQRGAPPMQLPSGLDVQRQGMIQAVQKAEGQAVKQGASQAVHQHQQQQKQQQQQKHQQRGDNLQEATGRAL